MTTARDIIAGAYQRLGLLPLGAGLDPGRAAAGIDMYNGMLNAWAADGIFPGGPNPPVLQQGGNASAGGYPPYGPSDTSTTPAPAALSFGLNDAFPFLPQFVEGAKAMLAVELASASGIEALPSTQKRAQKAYEALLAYYVIAPQADQDTALTWMPSLRR
ncbi:MAG: hypothetical protein HY765_04610 [Rhodomicrobium sp.]|nr:hypothetical protein [Rhodomicrobium sp.]